MTKDTDQKRVRFATYTLEWPIETEEERLVKIELRRLTGAEVAALQDSLVGENASEAGMIAAFTDVTAETIGRLDADDFFELKDMVFDFLPKRIRAALEAQAEQAMAELMAETVPIKDLTEGS